MCGLVGFINCGSKEFLKKSTDIINHRGPDDTGIQWFYNNKSGLGFKRLSIIDISSKGHQPMFDIESNNWIVFNGEIYNYKSIRKTLVQKGHSFNSDTDTEVLLKAYCEWGSACLQQLNGIFSFAIYNEQSQFLFIARDRLGIKPLYYYRSGYKLVFASEIKSILASNIYIKEPDLYSLHTPIHYQASPFTGFKNIYKLAAGSYLKFQNGKLEINKYWKINPEENTISEVEAIEKLDYLLNDSIKLQMIADVPIGSMLSGGLDSSLISVLMQNKINKPINAYTIKFNKNDLRAQGNVDDSYYANFVSEKYGFKHNEIIIEPDIVKLLPKMIWHLEEPISDPSVINTYLISSMARKHGIKVLLSGMGADEVFGGYRSYLACLKADILQKLPPWIDSFASKLVNIFPDNIGSYNLKYIRWLKQFLNISTLPQFERHLNSKNSAFNSYQFQSLFSDEFDYYKSPSYSLEKKYFYKYYQMSYLTKMTYCDTNIYMCDHNLAYTDKASMAASIEVRPPLIDHRIVEFMFSVKPDYKINNNTQKYLLKKVSEKYLPQKIIYRSKAPFSAPMRGWLKNQLNEMMNDLLSEETIKKRGFYNWDNVNKLKCDNNSGKVDNSQLIWRLMTNELWFKEFFE